MPATAYLPGSPPKTNPSGEAPQGGSAKTSTPLGGASWGIPIGDTLGDPPKDPWRTPGGFLRGSPNRTVALDDQPELLRGHTFEEASPGYPTSRLC